MHGGIGNQLVLRKYNGLIPYCCKWTRYTLFKIMFYFFLVRKQCVSQNIQIYSDTEVGNENLHSKK